MKFASLFTGFGGADIGALQAGLEPVWGVEVDRSIANVAKNNFGFYLPEHLNHYVYALDVREIDLLEEHRPDWLHASPPCINASRAKNGKETEEDIKLAKAICRAIDSLQPDYFSLENVTGYLQFDSFQNIKNQLLRLGYYFHYWVLDCANHGVPQNRARLFLVASKHAGKISGTSDMPMEPRKSWHEAIADLIPTLKQTTLTEWQKEAIKKRFAIPSDAPGWRFLEMDIAIQRSGARKKDGIPNNTIRLWNEPMFTIKAMSGNVRPNVNQVTLVIDGVPYEADAKCLARWQTFPDWYQLPADKKLAVKGLGNAVPPLMMQKIIEAVLG